VSPKHRAALPVGCPPYPEPSEMTQEQIEKTQDTLARLGKRVNSAEEDDKGALPEIRQLLDKRPELAWYLVDLANDAEEKGVLDLSTQEHWHERMDTVGLANDPAAFRAALKRREQASLPPAPPKALTAENETKGNRFLTQEVSGDSRGCHAR